MASSFPEVFKELITESMLSGSSGEVTHESISKAEARIRDK
ncbi:MAG TPA: hypothetical protein VF884_12955 [Nitrososphaeraceae archaeon]